MAFDRSKAKAAKLEANKAATKELTDTFKSNSNNNRGEYHKIEPGNNIFRILPPHNENDPSFQPKAVYWLEVLIDKKDDNGNPTGKQERINRPIFDSRIHGGTEKDIVDEFIKFARKIAYESFQDLEDRKKALYPISGWRDKKGKWQNGILCNQSFVAYATKGDITPENIGRLEIYKTDKDKLEELNIGEGFDEPITTDIFSDPDEGVQFNIRLYQDENGKSQRAVAKREFNPKNWKTYDDFMESQQVPDNVLEKWQSMESLSSMFKNAYKRTDFLRALEALQFFDDEKLQFEVFDHDEFQEIVKEIEAYYDEDEENTKESDELDELDRDELKAYIKDEKLPIRVKSAWTEDQIRDEIRKIEGDNKNRKDEEEDEEDDDQSETKPLQKGSVRSSALNTVRNKKSGSNSKKYDDDLPF
jgi:hypothetical protein